MHFDSTSMMNALAMGGYAMYVWPAYGLGVLVILSQVCSSYRQKRDVLKRLRRFWEQQTK